MKQEIKLVWPYDNSIKNKFKPMCTSKQGYVIGFGVSLIYL